MRNSIFFISCPQCGVPLKIISSSILGCPKDGLEYIRKDGIWRFLSSDRLKYYQRFIQEYETVRSAEGRGSADSAYYQALPFQDLTGRMASDWKIRATGFQTLLTQVIAKTETNGPLKILDLGAGNCWLSYRLTLKSHTLAAVDLLTNSLDGLGAHIHYPVDFTVAQAEFDNIPFANNQFDIVIYNASFHYAVSYRETLREAMRCLTPDGQIVILDSPIYNDRASGEKMVREREKHFKNLYGFSSNSIPSENFLTYQKLARLAFECSLSWQTYEPYYNLKWALRPWLAKLRGSREPAKFLLIVGEREHLK